MRHRKVHLRMFMFVVLFLLPMASAVSAQIYPGTAQEPLSSEATAILSESVAKPAIPPRVDICLLEDETGSFWDDIEYLKAAAPAIYDDIVASWPDAQFAVTGFRDYPMPPHGDSSDWVYCLFSSMNPDKAAWLSGVNLLSAKGGYDRPEAQYDAIVAAAGPYLFLDPREGLQRGCGWRRDKDVRRLLLVVTDAPFQVPGSAKPHRNDFHSTLSTLVAQDITLIGLKSPSAGKELDALAAATGGSVQPIRPDGSNIAEAIMAALEEIEAIQ